MSRSMHFRSRRRRTRERACILFLRGRPNANLGDMLVWLLGKYQKMDFYELSDLLKNQYGIFMPREKLIEIINSTDLYYDAIMEAVYIDYDTYFEEI